MNLLKNGYSGRGLFLLLAVLIWKPAVAQVPTDNPYAARYNTGAHWTDEFQWENVQNVLDIPGLVNNSNQVDSLVLKEQISALSQTGGGVLFFPAGDYHFSYDIMMESGVVLRGAPYGVTHSALEESFRPPTRFHFPKYEPIFEGDGTPRNTAFKTISFQEEPVSFCGFADLDLNRADLNFYVHEEDQACESILVFGIRQNNVADFDPILPGEYHRVRGYGWQRFPAWYRENVVLTVWNQSIIANSRFNDQVTDSYIQPGFITLDGDTMPDGMPFSYTMHRSLTVRRRDSVENKKPVVRENYVLNSEWQDKILVMGGDSLVADNVMVDSEEDKRILNQINGGMLSTRPMRKAAKLFRTNEYKLGKKEKAYYQLLEPKNFNRRKKYPVVLFYHGIDEWGKEADRLKNFVPVFTEDSTYAEHEVFVLVPHGLPGGKWRTSLDSPMTRSMQYSLDLLQDLMEKKYIDNDRVYVAGISDGANATWEILLRKPELFAAAVPLGGLYNFKPEQVERIKQIPIWLGASTDDNVIPIQYARFMAARLRGGGAELVYKEYDYGIGHYVWTALHTDPEFIPWLLSKSKPENERKMESKKEAMK